MRTHEMKGKRISQFDADSLALKGHEVYCHQASGFWLRTDNLPRDVAIYIVPGAIGPLPVGAWRYSPPPEAAEF